MAGKPISIKKSLYSKISNINPMCKCKQEGSILNGHLCILQLQNDVTHTAFRIFFNLLLQEPIFMQIRIPKIKFQLHQRVSNVSACTKQCQYTWSCKFFSNFFLYFRCLFGSCLSSSILIVITLATCLTLINDHQNNYF